MANEAKNSLIMLKHFLQMHIKLRQKIIKEAEETIGGFIGNKNAKRIQKPEKIFQKIIERVLKAKQKYLERDI